MRYICIYLKTQSDISAYVVIHGLLFMLIYQVEYSYILLFDAFLYLANELAMQHSAYLSI